MNPEKKTGPVRRIRLKCLDCCAGSAVEVKLCPSDDCALWPYRMGHRPKEGQESSKTLTRDAVFSDSPQG